MLRNHGLLKLNLKNGKKLSILNLRIITIT